MEILNIDKFQGMEEYGLHIDIKKRKCVWLMYVSI